MLTKVEMKDVDNNREIIAFRIPFATQHKLMKTWLV